MASKVTIHELIREDPELQAKLNGDEATQEIEKPTSSWPEPLAKDAFYGLAGDIVKKIEPHTEADQAALLISFLVMYGNTINCTSHFIVEADRHCMNLFACLVGITSKGRKGVSFGQIKNLFSAVDQKWVTENIKTGLSSGEGLIWAVRDDIWKECQHKKTGERKKELEVAGVEDKRLLVVEPEFSRTLRVANREGNPLSAIIRHAYDSGSLNIMTKNNPATATGAHISIIGHVTKAELLRYLDSTEASSGFGNRFLWVCVRRSKCLPEGGKLYEVDFKPLIQILQEAVDYGRVTGQIKLATNAKGLWYEVYPDLSEGKPGLLGAMIARGEAHVMRLACVYALLDFEREIKLEHLEAALAVWKYCEDSARFIFGDHLGDPVADEILKILKANPEGLTRTDISSHFGRNRKASHIKQALSMLSENGLVSCSKEQQVRGGRPFERWFFNR